MKGTPYLNPDPFCRFIGPRNWDEALIDDKLMTCLLDNGSQLNFVTPTYAHERGMDILSLDTLAQEIGGQLPPIAVMGGGMIKPEGFVIMNVRVPCVRGYNEDQIAIVLEDPEMKDCPVVLGTPTLFRVMEVIKESKISELAVPWANSRLSWLMRGVHAKMSRLQVKDVANKPIAPLSVDEVVRVTSKCMVPPFGHKVIHGRVGLVLQGYKMNVMTHGLEKRSPLLPLGLEVQSAYATLATGSSRVPVVLRNNTKDWLEIKKGTPIARMVAANLVPRVINAVSAKGPDPASTLMEAERQDLLLDKLDLSGLDEWPTEQAEKAHVLLKEYHNIFFLEKQDMGHTKAAEHKIVLKDPDTPPFKERFHRIPPQRHRSAAMDGCHHEAAHQGQRRSASLMQERFWWPGMARDLRNCIRKCGRCRKFEAAPPIAPMQPLTCSGPGELLHVDFTSIEETIPLKEEPVIRNVLVLQDHFSKYVVVYVVKDQTTHTAAVTLRNGYFGLFGAPAYLVSDQGKAFTGHLITHLCELYGVHKLRTLPYHAQTNGQVERMNQTIIRMIGKLAEDKKACWSEHLPELLSAYNGTRSAVTGYSPYYLLFGRKNRMPVDCLFPTLCELPHRTKMEVSVATMQKQLKEAFEVARCLTYEEATKQRRYYDRRAGAVTLQPGDVVMVRTDGFVGKRKVKDHWEDGGFIVESQLGDWPVYKVRCPSADDRRKPKYRILHRNRLLLVANEDVDDASGQAQAKATPMLPNATHEALSVGVGSQEPLPSLVTRQGGELTSMVWLNGEFCTKPWTQVVSGATPSPPDLHVDEVSGDESTEPEGT